MAMHISAPLVYVNYGAPSDYEELAAMGVSVKGAIVIARYGQTWRGIKPKVAAEHGAVGCNTYLILATTAIFAASTPDGPDAAGRGCAARQCHGHACLSGRSGQTSA